MAEFLEESAAANHGPASVADKSNSKIEGLLDQHDKRDPYAFGLGKRGNEYSFGLGKKRDPYAFGLGKRGGMGSDYAFGMGKKDDPYAFGLGKRADR